MQICIISIVYWHFYTSSCPVASQCSNNVVISCLLTIHPFECLFSCHLIQTARWRYWRFLNPYHYLSQQDFAWLPLSDASFYVKNRGIRRLNSDKAWKSEEWLNPTLTSNAFSLLFGVGIYELRNGYQAYTSDIHVHTITTPSWPSKSYGLLRQDAKSHSTRASLLIQWSGLIRLSATKSQIKLCKVKCADTTFFEHYVPHGKDRFSSQFFLSFIWECYNVD